MDHISHGWAWNPLYSSARCVYRLSRLPAVDVHGIARGRPVDGVCRLDYCLYFSPMGVQDHWESGVETLDRFRRHEINYDWAV